MPTNEKIKTHDDGIKARIRAFQKRHKLSGKDLAAIMEMPESNLSSMLNCREDRKISTYRIKRLCEEYNVTADHFIFDDFPEETYTAHDVCSVTGLSEDAVKKLAEMAAIDTPKEKAFAQHIINCLNRLIVSIDTTALGNSVLFDIGDFIDAGEMELVDSDPDKGTRELKYLNFKNPNTGIRYFPKRTDYKKLIQEYFKDNIFDKLRDLGCNG